MEVSSSRAIGVWQEILQDKSLPGMPSVASLIQELVVVAAPPGIAKLPISLGSRTTKPNGTVSGSRTTAWIEMAGLLANPECGSPVMETHLLEQCVDTQRMVVQLALGVRGTTHI